MEELPKKEQKALIGGRLQPPDVFRKRLKNKRFILTCAQNNTRLHKPFWNTLLRLAKRRKARLLVGRISYNKNGWQRITKDSATLDGQPDGESVWYTPEINEYICDEQVKIAEDLVFCGELDILPTAALPFTGLDNYTGANSGVIPHTKMQMKSLATMKYQEPKFLYTTGAVTMHNYIQRRAGQIAEFHHVYGALYVEVDAQGRWFARQLNADDDGIVYDIDGVHGPTWSRPVSEFGRPFLNLGDAHTEMNDTDHMAGAIEMMQRLNFQKVFVHDLLDMRSRNHHNISDPHFLAEMGTRTVEQDVAQSAWFVHGLSSAFPDTQIFLIRSNHDEALGRWVRDGSKFPDYQNLGYWHELNALKFRAIERKQVNFDLYRRALELACPSLVGNKQVYWHQEDDSVQFLGIEFGMHGHLGVNGSRPSPRQYRQLGVRANTGHTHSAGIIDGVWTAGLLAKLDMKYNKGPSSWSCTHIITWPNGKRTMITQRGNKWHAGYLKV